MPRSVHAWQVTFADSTALPTGASGPTTTPLSLSAATAEQRPTAFVYSEGYNTRRKIHMIASYLTLPLFVTQVLAGQKLYDEGGGTARSVHDAGMAGIIALFTVNTVTGGWNFWEARKDPNGKGRRLVHSLLMFGADIGFVATGALAPDDDEGGGSSNRSLHRSVAITSMGVAAGPDKKAYPVPAADGVTIDKSTQVILVRLQGTVIAFNLACPHENTALRWKQAVGRFECTKHDSKYSPDGTFIGGRATRHMDRLAIVRDGATVVVDLTNLVKSDTQPKEWAAAVIAV